MAAGQNVPACHFLADMGGEGSSVWFVLLEVVFSSGARWALPPSVRVQKLQWATPAISSEDVPYRMPDTPQHTHTILPGKHIHIFMRSPKRCLEGHRQEGESVIWSQTKMCVQQQWTRKGGLGSCALLLQSFHSITQQLAATCEFGILSGNQMWTENVRETLKLTLTICLDCLFLQFSVLPVCWSTVLSKGESSKEVCVCSLCLVMFQRWGERRERGRRAHIRVTVLLCVSHPIPILWDKSYYLELITKWKQFNFGDVYLCIRKESAEAYHILLWTG